MEENDHSLQKRRQQLLSFSQVRSFAHEQPKELKRFLKFATVGAIGAITHFAILNIGLLLEIPFLIANTLGFIVAVLQNFMFNRFWTFPESKSRAPRGQLTQFAVVSVVGLVLNQGVALLCRYLLLPFWATLASTEQIATWINDNFAVAIAIGVVLFWNFLVNRLWTYRGL